MIKKLFTEHPASVHVPPFAHLCPAPRFTAAMSVATCPCLPHAFLPFLCVTTGSRKIIELHDRMVTNRVHKAAQAS